jgi:Plavaka transposase
MDTGPLSTALVSPPSPRLSDSPALAQGPQPEGSRSRSGRIRTFPTSRYKDFLPAQPIPLAHAPQPPPHHQPEPELHESDTETSPPPLEVEPTTFETEPNDAGIFRVYPVRPTSDPDSIIELEDVCESPNFAVSVSKSNQHPPLGPGIGDSHQDQNYPFHAPFRNPSVFRLVSWFYNGQILKSIGDLDTLVREVFKAPDFNLQDFTDFSAAREVKRLDDHQSSNRSGNNLAPSNGWLKSTVDLCLPCERQNLMKESKAPTFAVHDIYHRDIMDIVISAFQDPEIFPTLHLTPYMEYRTLGAGNSPERVYGEVYSTDSFFDAWKQVQAQPRVSGDDIERVMVGLMLWSDSTHLTNFGNASLWPVYLSLGNQSKYIRTKPSSFSHHHLAYLPSVSGFYQITISRAHGDLQLPDDIQDAYLMLFRKAPSSAVLTHLKRELMHAVYDLILNSRFVDAYKNGVLITCYDETQRRLFVRVLTYSADYPEK